MKQTLLAGALALTLMPGLALAGAFGDFEGQLRDAYGNYRQALSLTNMGKAGPAAQALQDFSDKWQVLVTTWGQNPPPQYVDDPGFGTSLSSVSATIAKAQDALGGGHPAEAHTDLEAVRGTLGALHLRNGLMGFSDRMNAYHAQMEKVLKGDFKGPKGLADLTVETGALQWLAQDIAAHPAPDAEDPSYAPLVKAFEASVAALVTAVEAGDAKAAMAARKGLKPAYAKLFVKFG